MLALVITLILGVSLYGQTSDLDLLEKQTFTIAKYERTRVVKFGISEKHNPILKYNPISFIFSSLLFTYQKWLSPQVSVDCLYSPSCSEYTRQLFKRYGLIGGFITSSDRLMRCDRISATTINHISIDDQDGKVHESVDRYVLKKQR
jgi:uncharacterized protein